jgi:hypothetical protein
VCYGIIDDDEDVMFTIEHELFFIRTINLPIGVVFSSMVNIIVEELTTRITNSTILLKNVKKNEVVTTT